MSAALTAELRPKTAVVRRAVIRGFFNFCLAGEEGTLTLELGMQLSGLVLRDCGSKNDSKVVQHYSTMSDCSWPKAAGHQFETGGQLDRNAHLGAATAPFLRRYSE